MNNKINLFSIYYGWWKNIDKFIFSIITLLFIIGLFFSLVSTSLIASDRLDTNNYSFFFKHLTFILMGFLIIFIPAIVPSKRDEWVIFIFAGSFFFETTKP